MKRQLNCLGKNTKKYIAFTVAIEKEVTRFDKNGEETTKNTPYRLKFNDTARFMASALAKLSEGIHKIICKYRYNDGKCEICRIKYKYCDSFLEYTNFKDDLIEGKFLCSNKKYQQKFDKNLKE